MEDAGGQGLDGGFVTNLDTQRILRKLQLSTV